MANTGTSAVRIIDSDNEVVTVTGGRLDVNAVLSASDNIEIGNVDIKLNGTGVSADEGNADAGTLRVTIADDDNHWGTVGAVSASDGTAHAQLRYIGDVTANQQTIFSTISSNTSFTTDLLGYALKTLGTSTYTEGSTYGNSMAAVRNDTLAALVDTDNEFAPLQVNDVGALYATGNSLQNGTLSSYNFTVMGESKAIDGSALPNTVAEGRNARLAVSRSGIAYTCLTDDAGASDLGTTITTHLSEIEGAVETIEGAVSGSEMQVDVVAALPAGSNAIGKLAANSGVDIGDVDVTSMPSDTFVAEGGSLGKGVLLQGDDGTDRHNLQCDSQGLLEVRLYTGSTGGITSAFKADKDSYNEAAIGISAKAKRSDALTNLTNVADGDWTSLQVDAQGALYTTHGITGMQSDNNEGVDDSTAEVLKSSTACKRVDMQADSANTGYIYVGGSDVSAVKGIRLAPGDFYSIDCDNTADIYVLASVDEEDIHFTYYT